ncbi:XRE family transcriptional regulator [Nesterenkonia xinjiangensis]|uniref:HTH cro/C1-type domain-containing protein n=1 Tax=Nesterenkonia xinjiangensis TaxID=225327 RepID=A0A7Z0K9V9_9MICC|nr:XRE family transcriptional regulator [Nesterenkonia xinjiangensis]NYJ79129.1 hypothetical protein [Nesterenkonia xinjiangensis]
MDEVAPSLHEMTPREILRARRRALGRTQQQLAEAIGTTQSVIAAVESGRRPLSVPMRQRLHAALTPDPTELLQRHRETIKQAAETHGFTGVRVFGSVARGTAEASSDLDLFVEYADPQQRQPLEIFGLQRQLEGLLGIPVDVNLLTGRPLKGARAQQALKESIAL